MTTATIDNRIETARQRVARYTDEACESRLRGDVAAACRREELAERLAEDIERLRSFCG